ncbi:MAG: hypothetical protein ACREAW_04710, partial [Nitrososphaera sp.]
HTVRNAISSAMKQEAITKRGQVYYFSDFIKQQAIERLQNRDHNSALQLEANSDNFPSDEPAIKDPS